MMEDVIVDTDVVSFGFKADSRALLYEPHLDGRNLVISFMTLAELLRWALARNWGLKRRLSLERHIAQRFTVYHSDEGLCRWWSAVTDSASRNGFMLDPADAWHAATALMYGVPLVTHNPDDYRGITGLKIITEAGP